MEFSMEWNIICRICLQEGEMHSIYEKDEKDLTIYDKITTSCNIKINKGMNLPEQICSKCLEDLTVACRFHNNCESSEAILQSLIEGNSTNDLVMASDTGEIYKYKPPEGLKVQRVKTFPIKIEKNFENEGSNNDISNDCDDIPNIDYVSDSEEGFITPKDEYLRDHGSDLAIDKFSADVKMLINNEEISMPIQLYEVKKEENVCTIKPVKTNKSSSKEKLKVVSAEAVTTKPDGTTVIRVRKNTEENKPLKICEICGNTYKYKHALESHMRRHRNEKPFACEICGRSFVINFELRRHMRTHTGQKPYPCSYCGRRFSDFGSRIKHERTHTGERPYTCDTCGKSFAYSHVLSSHILTHTGEKRYVCSQCGKRFTKSHHLKAHINTHLKQMNKSLTIIKNDCTIQQDKIYDNNDKVFEEVLTVLTAQPKTEQLGDNDGNDEVIYTEESHHTLTSINMH